MGRQRFNSEETAIEWDYIVKIVKTGKDFIFDY